MIGSPHPPPPPPSSVEDIFEDYKARRSGVVQALTSNADAFFTQCDPAKENLCLYGLPDGSWHLNKPPLRVLPQLPEPTLGINFARDGMKREDWLALIGAHSDSWLLSVAFYYGANLNHNDRERLFSLINDLPTVYEAFKQAQAVKDKPIRKVKTFALFPQKLRKDPRHRDEGYGEDDDEHSETLCGICEGQYYDDEFWIGCDICEKWYHGTCVTITPEKAESIGLYHCPSCSSKKSRLN